MMRLSLLLILCFFAQIIYGQSSTADTTTQKQFNEIKDQFANLKQIIKDNVKNQTTKVGTLSLVKTENVNLYDFHKSKIKFEANLDSFCFNNGYLKRANNKVIIDSIVVETKDGYISKIIIYGDSGSRVFSNIAPIALTAARFNKVEVIGTPDNNGYDGHKYILLNYILHYTELKSYIPNNDYFILSPTNDSHNFQKEVGLNTIFDLRLYTDALSTFGGKANGLVQTDVNFKQVFHRSNILNRGIFFCNYFKFNFNASKFDSKVAYTDSSRFTRTSFIQKSWLNADLSLNIINGWLTKHSLNSFYLDFGGGLSLSNLAGLKDTSTITSTYLFLQPGFDFKTADNIGISISSKFIWSYSPQTNFDNQDGERMFIKPAVDFFWNPLGNEASRIFGRVAYIADMTDTQSNFIQLQFGSSLQLTGWVK